MRVFQVAREFNISNEALVAFLTKLGHDVRNQMSLVSDEAYALVVEKFGEKTAQVDEEYEFRRRLREKKAQEEAKKVEAQKNLERRLAVAQEMAKEMPELRKQREASAVEAAAAKLQRAAEEAKKAEMAASAAAKPAPKGEEAAAAAAGTTAEAAKAKTRKKLVVIEIPPEETTRRPREKERPAEEAPKAPARPAKETPAGKEMVPVARLEEMEAEEGRHKKKRKRKRKKKGAETPAPAAVPAVEADHKRKRPKKKKKVTFNEAEIQETIRQTMAAMEEPGKGKKKKRRTQTDEEIEVDESPIIKVSEFMSVSELAKLMEAEASEIIRKCMELGMMVSINQRLDMDTITLLAGEYGYEVAPLAEFGEDLLEKMEREESEDEAKLTRRPPVVTIMGHVDHGKTSLLDYIRKSNIIAGEAGGITQHIGAYEVKTDDGKPITFLDTPGHEAFTAMRARGAQVTDIVVLVVAADDRVMPQTIEAINHAKAANVPIVVAVNKIDLPNANPDLIRKELADNGVLVEEWGGQTVSVEISAKKGINVDKLLEMILLQAELLDLKAEPTRRASGVVLESKRDTGRGVVATVLIQNGTLHVGDPFICGGQFGKVRAMFNEKRERLQSAPPATPAEVLGWSGVPQAGDVFKVVKNESEAREIATTRSAIAREHEHRLQRQAVSLMSIQDRIKRGELHDLNLVVKADVGGSVEVLRDTLTKLSTDEVKVRIIHEGVGLINESDILLAVASNAIVIGFHTRPDAKAHQKALDESIDVRLYRVIYEVEKDIKDAMSGLLAPERVEKISGSAEIRRVFHITKVGNVAGCYVASGTVHRGDRVRIYRGADVIWDGRLATLKRIKDDVREVPAGFECGMSFEGFDEIKEGDVAEAYTVEEVARHID